MKTMKKITCAFMALLLAMCSLVPAFAEGEAEPYDYNKDSRFDVISDTENGEFAWGVHSPAMFQVVTKKMFTMGNLPTNDKKETLKDLLSTNDAEMEGIDVAAYYAFKCPACGKASGSMAIKSIYSDNKGVCPHCGAAFPNPDELKIYRFIVVPEDSAHYDIFSEYNLAKYAGDVYGATAKDYGDGKDLGQANLVFEKNPLTNQEYLVDFSTGKAKNDTNAVIYMLLAKLNYKLTPVMDKIVVSKLTAAIYKFRLFIAKLWENGLTLLVGGQIQKTVKEEPVEETQVNPS